MKRQKHTKNLLPGNVVTYRDKYNGGLYHAVLVKIGRKWATVKDYWPAAQPRRHRVPASEIQLAAGWGGTR